MNVFVGHPTRRFPADSLGQLVEGPTEIEVTVITVLS